MTKISIPKLLEKKKNGEKLTVLTAYDYTFARILDEAGIDIILVGDSLGMVLLGYPTTLPVTMEDMIRHTQAVARGTQNALIVGDMPFNSYQASEPEAVRNAGRFLKEGGAQAVKLEGGSSVVETVKRLVSSGIPVMGHLGLTPQSINVFGGYKVQGKSEAAQEQLLRDAEDLQNAGCISVVLECVPASLGEEMSKRLSIPVIGIGAGPKCDGQVLVLHDCLGLTLDLNPKFVKHFAGLKEEAAKGVRGFIQEVKSGKYPDKEHSF